MSRSSRNTTTPTYPVRFCPICQIADDAPRHAIYGDDPNVARHMDCCRDQPGGCPDWTCPIITSGGETLKGQALRDFINSLDPVDLQARLDARTDEQKNFTTDTEPTTVSGSGS